MILRFGDESQKLTFYYPMKFKEIAKRLTGFNTPIFGITWKPLISERDVAQKIINQLEDRRVLYNPSEMEVPHHCVKSVLQIRSILTDALNELNKESNLASNIRAMRASCRKFLDAVEADEKIVKCGNVSNHYASWHFNGAVGELRGVFGVHIAKIAVQYGIDIESQLSSILPTEPD